MAIMGDKSISPETRELLARIDALIIARNTSRHAVSMAATSNPNTIRRIAQGHKPRALTLEKIAKALGTTRHELLAPTTPTREPGGDAAVIEAVAGHSAWRRDLPVLGTAPAGVYDGRVGIEMMTIHGGAPIDYLRRPPTLEHRGNLYVVYNAGDSMAPAIPAGAPVLVDPHQPPANADLVVVQLKAGDGGGAAGKTADTLIKELVSRGSQPSGAITLRQYQPPLDFEVTWDRITALHRIKPWHEAFL